MDEDMFITDEERIVLDLHDMQEDEARFYLERAIDSRVQNKRDCSRAWI